MMMGCLFQVLNFDESCIGGRTRQENDPAAGSNGEFSLLVSLSLMASSKLN